jgi:hypothetical protein
MKRMFVVFVLGLLAGAVIFPGCGGGAEESCAAGKAFHSPGCAEGLGEALEDAGCYAPCEEEGAACEDGTCRAVVTNPCPCSPGETCCDACGSVTMLCVP